MGSADTILRHRRRQTPEERWAEIMEDARPFLGMTPEEHDELLQQVSLAAWQQLLDQPRLIEPEPPAPDFPQIWRRLQVRRA